MTNFLCFINLILILILDSERSHEGIDFTMMCVFWFALVSVCNITSHSIASIYNVGGGFRWESEYPWCIK